MIKKVFALSGCLLVLRGCSKEKEKKIIKAKGSLSSTLDEDNRENGKQNKGIITPNYPVFQAIKNSKDDFIY